MIKALTTLIEADSHGIDWRADLEQELEMIDACLRDLAAMKQARRELAVEAGYAHFEEVLIKEHVRREHTQNRFRWNKLA